MNQIKSNDIKLDENLATQGTNSTFFTKINKVTFNKTISSNFSQTHIKTKKISRIQPLIDKGFKSVKIPEKKTIENYNSKKIETLNVKRSKSKISIHESPKKENEKNKESPLIINSLLPTNINSYQHLIRGTNFGIYGNLNWTLRLRDYSHKGVNDEKVIEYKDYYYRENIKAPKIKQEKIKLTENFNPPSYYDDDLKKYKKRMQTGKRPLITQLNPNYNNIRHLLFANNNGNVNFSQFYFETTLRNLQSNKKDKENKKWEILPIVRNNKYISKFLSPVTPRGIQNVKTIEAFLHKDIEYKFKDDKYEDNKIKKKIIYNNRNYTISGIGETLGEQKYNNRFGDINMFANKKILSTESNPTCKFELGLRIYGPYKDKKSLTQANFRPKKKLKKSS